MKNEQLIRELISCGEPVFRMSLLFMAEENQYHTELYRRAIRGLEVIDELKKEIGLLEDKQEGKLTQSKIEFEN